MCNSGELNGIVDTSNVIVHISPNSNLDYYAVSMFVDKQSFH